MQASWGRIQGKDDSFWCISVLQTKWCPSQRTTTQVWSNGYSWSICWIFIGAGITLVKEVSCLGSMWLDQTKLSIRCWETNCEAAHTTLHRKGWVEGTLGIPLQSRVWKDQCYHWRSEGQRQIGWELWDVTTTSWWWRWWWWRWRRRRWATFIEGPARKVWRRTWSWKTAG